MKQKSLLAFLLTCPIATPDWMVAASKSLSDHNSLLYFFSALAQCAAGFAALIGVFAVFRLQANPSMIDQKYSEVKIWIRKTTGEVGAETLPYSDVKARLNSIIDKKYYPQFSSEAKKHLEEILERENFPSKLNNTVTYPLKLWAAVFLGSMLAIPICKLFVGWFGLIICLAVSGFVFYVLVGTKKVIQKCLETK